MISKQFVFAGRAVFTVDNGQGQHYTYKISAATFNTDRFFANVLTGSNEYVYLGEVVNNCGRLTAVTTKKTKISPDDVRFRVLNFALRCVQGVQQLPIGYAIQHEGRCGRCSRALTDPESIRTGLGPHCRTL